MNKKVWLFIVLILFLLNTFCWKEVFALSSGNNLEVYFLNVGQGDSTFIKTPENYQIIIDGGQDSLALQKISEIIPFWDKTIDLVILTHPEKDHMQGLLEILKKYKADYILQAGIKKNSDGYNEWLKTLENQEKRGASIITVKSGDIVRLGSSKINIVFPLENLIGQETEDSTNEACIVSKLFFGNNSFLFTGDISAKTEKEIIRVFDASSIKADVLKVAHHGSKYSTSEEFLEKITPQFAVIPVGKNSYGHPTAEVLQRLEKFGIKVLRTDVNNTVKFISDGNNLKLINQN
jgi:competence protein ComEC